MYHGLRIICAAQQIRLFGEYKVNTKSAKSKSSLWIISLILIAANIFCVYSLGLFSPSGWQSDPYNDPAPPITDRVSSSDSVVSSGTVSITDIEEETGPDTFTLQMGGDILLHSSVTNASSNGDDTYSLAPYVSLIKDAFVADLRIANLETPVDVHGGNKNLESYPCFNVPIEILDTLKSININMVSTANNHSIDQGYDGLFRTLENIRSSGLLSVGTYATEEESQIPVIMEINNIKVGIISLTSVANIPIRGENAFAVNNCKNKSDAIIEHSVPQINALKENGAELIVMIIHWGSEYVDSPSKDLKNAAEGLCEAGVDILLGGHSHCVQPIEWLTVERNGTESRSLVVYSLGNFFANQTGLDKPKTQYGMIVSVKAQRDEDGIVRVSDAFYLPTYCYVRGEKGDNYMRICYPGQFALSDDVNFDDFSDVFKNQNAMNTCKSAWKHVTSVVGDAIPAVATPGEYPQGFFEAD